MSETMIVPGRINGIDISPAQASFNAAKVKAAGFEFVYIQASRYSSQKAAKFAERVRQCKDAGLAVGAYHFCSHDSDPVNQMKHFLDASGGLGMAAGELPPMIDWEFCTPAKYNPHPLHCSNWLRDARSEAQLLWYGSESDEDISGRRQVIVYTYPDYARSHQPIHHSASMAGLCYASYKSEPDGKGGYRLVAWLPSASQGPLHPVPRPWADWTLWQYSGDRGHPVPGVSGDCDRQIFNGGTGDQLQSWKTLLGSTRTVAESRPADRPVSGSEQHEAAVDEVTRPDGQRS